jgi:hypothetical protein
LVKAVSLYGPEPAELVFSHSVALSLSLASSASVPPLAITALESMIPHGTQARAARNEASGAVSTIRTVESLSTSTSFTGSMKNDG